MKNYVSANPGYFALGVEDGKVLRTPIVAWAIEECSCGEDCYPMVLPLRLFAHFTMVALLLPDGTVENELTEETWASFEDWVRACASVPEGM